MRIYKRKRQSMSFLRKSIIHFDSDNRHAFNIPLHANVALLESCWIRDSNAENRKSKGLTEKKLWTKQDSSFKFEYCQIDVFYHGKV